MTPHPGLDVVRAAPSPAPGDDLTATARDLREATLSLTAAVQAFTDRAAPASLTTATVPLPADEGLEFDVTIRWDKNLGDASYQVALTPNELAAPLLASAEVHATWATSCIVVIRATEPLPDGATLTASAYRAG